jgi:hypothetical protein
MSYGLFQPTCHVKITVIAHRDDYFFQYCEELFTEVSSPTIPITLENWFHDRPLILYDYEGIIVIEEHVKYLTITESLYWYCENAIRKMIGKSDQLTKTSNIILCKDSSNIKLEFCKLHGIDTTSLDSCNLGDLGWWSIQSSNNSRRISPLKRLPFLQ